MDMREKIIHFLKYNNTVSIAFAIILLGFGAAFAANPEMREDIYSSEETVISINNELILSTDFDSFNFNLRINSVTEDEKNYYAIYTYQTLAITDGAWQAKEVENTLTVSKEALAGKDLGLYVAQELGENINYELSYLKKVQKLEREKGESQKVVTVEYSGLIGKLLDPREMIIEGYTPVIPEPLPETPITDDSKPEEIIISTPYIEEEILPEMKPTPENESGDAGDNQEEYIQEATSTPQDLLPAPAEMINEDLVKEVVEELLQEQATSSPQE